MTHDALITVAGMGFSAELADEVRVRLAARTDVTEKQMFGGIAFMVGGNMAVGVSGEELMVRVGKAAHAETVSLPGARIFDMSGRPIEGWLLVSPEGFATEVDLDSWIERGLAGALSLPPK